MKIDELQELGVDAVFIDHLRSRHIEDLTDIQALAIRAGITEGKSMIVCAPTSSGKTLVGELALYEALRSGRRGIYLVSHKALADQKFEDFQGRFGERSSAPIASVGLSTGDREEGDVDAQLLVATYEKALGLLLANQIDPRKSLFVADELQILGDSTRGPNIEALCSVLRQRGCGSFVALTATVENPEDLAGWMQCHYTVSKWTDVDLIQEIWFQGKGHRIVFGQADGEDFPADAPLPTSAVEAAQYLNHAGRGPVLVFTESRREASDYASAYSKQCKRDAEGLEVAEQLDLFSEPTEASEQLRDNAERGVAFHTADLSPQERQVIEQGFLDAKFEVCFATSTLAAGVNFPFKSVVFPKLTYQWGDRRGTLIPRSEYRNMSGRAGRLGMHQEGYAVLLPTNKLELRHATEIALPENDRIESQLVSLSMRRTVLTLISSGLVDGKDNLSEFFKNTLYWYLTLANNPEKLERILEVAGKAVDWLLDARLIEQQHNVLLPTPFGKATAISGLLPTTAKSFASALALHAADLEEHFTERLVGILHWVCSCEEFTGNHPSRFLPWVTSRGATTSSTFLASKALLAPLDRTNVQVMHAAHAMALYINGEAERKINFATKLTAGQVNRLAADVSWVLDGLHRIVCVSDLGCSQKLANHVAMLARRVRWGAPAEVIDVIRIAEQHKVPGFGRQRAMALLENGLVTCDDILAADKQRLTDLLRSEQRANALLRALSDTVGLGQSRLAGAHLRVGKQLGIGSIIEDCNRCLGIEYEQAILKLLQVETSWTVRQLDDGKRQNVPDILIKLGEVAVILECKTTTKKQPLIKKEDAFAVLQKAADFDSTMRRVTLGKPVFDEHVKIKTQASSDITLVEHSSFVEGVLRVHAGAITAMDFLLWIGQPGLAEIERLVGAATYAVTS